MKRLLLISISLIWISTGCEKKEPTVKDVLTATVNNYNKHHSISYDLNYRIKTLFNDDTIKDLSHCVLIRDPEDTLFNGTIWYTGSDSIDIYYDQEYIYSVKNKTKSIIQYQDPSSQKWAIRGSIVSDYFNIYFLKPMNLLKIIDDSTNQVQMMDTTSNQQEFWKIDINYPDEAPFSELKNDIWINKSDMVIEKITFQVKFQNNYQFKEWLLSDIKFDDIKKSDLSVRLDDLEKSYSIEEYSEENKNNSDLLQSGDKAPNIQGKLFPGGKIVSLKDYKGKVIFLDFWHMACYPCIKSIPHINELQSVYNSRGLIILSLNQVDNSEKGMKRLPDFIQKNKMNYPVVLTEKDVSQLYHVSGNPSFYIINKEGNIIFSQSGYSENMNDTISNILDKELQ